MLELAFTLSLVQYRYIHAFRETTISVGTCFTEMPPSRFSTYLFFHPNTGLSIANDTSAITGYKYTGAYMYQG
ncbi:hypothetical protein BGX38DRAFT_1192898 [Terfezia claveryi]|nr:hypothetical protein BGX38DRAFT_1192898 [Terfezia claveryi]